MKHKDLITLVDKEVKKLDNLTLALAQAGDSSSEFIPFVNDMKAKIVTIKDLCDFQFNMYKKNPTDFGKGVTSALHHVLMRFVMDDIKLIDEMGEDFNKSYSINRGGIVLNGGVDATPVITATQSEPTSVISSITSSPSCVGFYDDPTIYSANGSGEIKTNKYKLRASRKFKGITNITNKSDFT
jgi:hypothetical protein